MKNQRENISDSKKVMYQRVRCNGTRKISSASSLWYLKSRSHTKMGFPRISAFLSEHVMMDLSDKPAQYGPLVRTFSSS